MPSASFGRFQSSLVAARVLESLAGSTSSVCGDPKVIAQACRMATIACAVGAWEGYIEGVIKEFVAKTRIHFSVGKKGWALITQFEGIVDKMMKELNTPNWERTRELLAGVVGIDPFASWIWAAKFGNQNDTKEFFDGVMRVRHAFAHGFPIPSDVPGLAVPGELDSAYVGDAIECITFFASSTDTLLEHDLKHKHGIPTGWT